MKNLLVLFIVATAFHCLGQVNAPTFSQNNTQTTARGFITSLPPAAARLDGSFFLYDEWSRANIVLNDSTTIADVNVKIDVKDEIIEIEYNKEIKILPVSRLLSLSLVRKNGETEEFANGSTFGKIAENLYAGQLLQVIVEGSVMLLSKTQSEIIRATNNPNPMLDVGKKNDEIVLKKKYVIVSRDKFIETGTNKSKFKEGMIKMFGEEVEPLLGKVNLKKEDELVALVEKLNDLDPK